MTDQGNRSSKRVRTLRAARIVWDNAQRTINCTIRDMSQSGARIELTDMVALPETFDIQLPPNKDLRPVQVVRQAGRVLGVMFLDVAFTGSSEGAGEAASGVALYDPRTGQIPGFPPIPDLIQNNLPWATEGATQVVASVIAES